MEVLDIWDQLSFLGLNAVMLTVGFPIFVWASRTSIGGYIAKRAENLATKADISELTRLQEGVKAEFNKHLEQQRAQGQMRLAVVEKRFQAHQEAHTLWFELLGSVHKSDIGVQRG